MTTQSLSASLRSEAPVVPIAPRRRTSLRPRALARGTLGKDALLDPPGEAPRGKDSQAEQRVEPLYSVIIPAFNEAGNIARCLRSLAAQDVPPGQMEIIVLDNGSTDGTAEIARRSGALVLVSRAGSIASLRNLGAAQARGAALAFLDADMEVGPGWLGRVGDYLFAGKADCVGFIDRVPPDAPWLVKVWDERRQERRERLTDFLPTRNLCVLRKVFLAVGGFDERLKTAEDKEFTMRLTARGFRVLSAPADDVVHWGCERSLGELARKEYWRQSSNLRLLARRGFSARAALFPMTAVAHVTLALFVAFALAKGDADAALAAAAAWAAPGIAFALRRLGLSLRAAPLAFLAWLRFNIAGLSALAEAWRMLTNRPRPPRAAGEEEGA